MHIVWLFLFSAMSVISLNVYSASFDCAKASTKVEKMICGDEELSRLDLNMAQLYKVAKEKETNSEYLKKDQLDWIKKNNKNCNVACLKKRYKSRISVLMKK